MLSKSGSATVGISIVAMFYLFVYLDQLNAYGLGLSINIQSRVMEKLNNRYIKVGAVGVAVFIIARLGIAIINSYVDPDVPMAVILSLIAGGIAVYFTYKAIRY